MLLLHFEVVQLCARHDAVAVCVYYFVDRQIFVWVEVFAHFVETTGHERLNIPVDVVLLYFVRIQLANFDVESVEFVHLKLRIS